jgi:hypothetical protein
MEISVNLGHFDPRIDRNDKDESEDRVKYIEVSVGQRKR